jgi:uncharacterized protein DUF6335
MAKGKAARRNKSRPGKGVGRRTTRSVKRSAKRPSKRSSASRKAKAAKPARPAKAAAARPSFAKAPARKNKAPARKKSPRLDRVRRTLDDTVQTPPSSLNMDRHGSAARTGRAGMEESRQNLGAGMGQDITGGDIDIDVEDAYFTGDGAPGGDNTSPDVDVVDDIGKALGVQYDDNEELKSSDKIVERDRHRWEMDPASSEDYKDRK